MKTTFDLNLCRVLVAVHRCHSVSEVAKQLRLSQPAVSAALSRLRAICGDPLFVKTHGGMQATVFASALVGPIEEALATIDGQMQRSVVFDPGSTRRTFTLGLSDIGEPLFLPKLTRQMARLAPWAKLQTVSPPRADLEHGLETGDIDLVLGYRPDLQRSNYFQQKLFSAGHVCLVRAGHPATNSPLTARAFIELEHILVRADNRAHEELEQFLIERKLRRRIRLYTPHFMAVPLVVAESDLIVTMPAFLARHMADLFPSLRIVVPAFHLPKFDVKQYWHRRFHHDPTNRWIRAQVSALFQSDREPMIDAPCLP